ncbi:glycosyltransferase family 2 protein [Pararhodospirillum oryzae]|nr:glycosyltransferase [Pararhodospirillum oryzae]
MTRFYKPTLKVLLAVLLASALHASGWLAVRQAVTPADVVGLVRSVSYTPYRNDPKTESDDDATVERMHDDLALLSSVSRQIRTYSAIGKAEALLPEVAASEGLQVTVGAWVSADQDLNVREMDAAVEAVKASRAVKAVIVGNESILRNEFTVDELIGHIRDIKRRTRGMVDVSTGETWDIWLAHPELASAVDFIAAHILPYWEGIPADYAVEYAFKRYDELRAAFPGKRVVIAEFGWPSRGYNDRAAEPDPVTQAKVLRDFINEAERLGVSYNIVEAFDQPWKTNEGSVGPYWGLFKADRTPKFPLQGLVEENYRPAAIAALIAGALLSLLGLRRGRARFREAFIFSLVANAMGVAAGLALVFPLDTYLNLGAAFGWATGLILMLILAVVVLTKVAEMAEVALGHRPMRLLNPLADGGVGGEGGHHPRQGSRPLMATQGPLVSDAIPERLASQDYPKVSVHIPAYREEPDMLIETLNGIAALDYPNFEVLVIINNTPEPYYWETVKARCEELGPHFKFVFLPKVAGFKAGALNQALPFMAEDAEIIALIDADYLVDPEWLKDLVPTFADPKVAIVQAPQDHRDGDESAFKAFLNDEYAGFFDIGMVQRNEDNAIITHGTMLLIRRSAFEAVGGWATDTIVEDTELGLRLLEAGYSAHYTNRRYGWGVLPDDFKAYKTQRNRWAYGAVQIIRKHWRAMLPGAPGLTPAQKMRFVTGWAVWLSDALGVAVAIFSLLWVPVILFIGAHLPITALMAPAIAAVVIHVAHAVLLYRLRVKISPVRSLRAAIAAMSLQFTVASAVLKALIGDNLPFQRTDKGGAAKRQAKGRWINRSETLLGLALVISSLVLWFTNYNQVDEVFVYAIALAVMSLPYLAAPFMGWLERSARRRAEKAAKESDPPGPGGDATPARESP